MLTEIFQSLIGVLERCPDGAQMFVYPPAVRVL